MTLPLIWTRRKRRPTTWNPLDKDADITLSNGDLTITAGTSAENNIRTISSITGGRRYHEITVGTIAASPDHFFGWANATETLTNFAGQTTNSCGWRGSDGGVFINGGSIGTANTYTTGNVLCFAYSKADGRLWVRVGSGNWNNDVSANPAANVGGFTTSISAAIYAWGSVRNAGVTHTANFGATSYNQARPQGFENW
jgi:hypothetical protein